METKLEHLEAVDDVGGSSQGKSVMHEVLEGYMEKSDGGGFDKSHKAVLDILPDDPKQAVEARGQYNKRTGKIDHLYRLSSNPKGVGETKGGSYTMKEYSKHLGGKK